MKVSLNAVKQYIDFELPPVDELVKRINEQLGGVEAVVDLGAKYKDAKIVKVVECEKHSDADRLNICKIDAGTGEFVQVVCGAPNVRADMWAVWLPPESIVPSTYGTSDEFKLGTRELRGVMSNGMLAAADELAIGIDHEGILEINPDEWKPGNEEIKPGVSFAKVYGLDDTIIDIENKMFTHRPDLFGQIGVAREIAGILGHKFASPGWYLDTPKFEMGDGLKLEVFNEAGEKVPCIMFASMKNVEIKPSPVWLQCALVAMGSKPINNIVDVTNYVMLLTAQPTHAYDYDKIRGAKIGARMAKKDEKVELLNGKSYELTEDDIVIADGEGPIGLGGIMGGGNSEVSSDTRNIVLEVATFDMYAVRKSSMRHGIFTDALTRFNKGQSPLQNDHIMNLLMMSVKDVSNAEQASEVVDQKTNEGVEKGVSVNQQFINERLGLQLTANNTKVLLENVEMKIDGEFTVTPPFWRTDIELPEDIVEEVGRLYGFDKLPRELPARSMKPASKNELRELKQSIRESLSRAGANEVLTYSFVHEKTLRNAQQNPDKAFQLGNALSPDLQYYRLSVLPSILTHINANIRSGYDEFALFEIGKGHHKDEFDEEGLPREFDRLAGVYTNKKNFGSAPYYNAKRIVEQLVDGNAMRYQPLSEFDFGKHDVLMQLAAPFDPQRSAMLCVGERFGGVVGELKQSVVNAFKLPQNTAGFELFLSFVKTAERKEMYTPLSKYPSIVRDISLKVGEDVSYEKLLGNLHEALKNGNKDTLDIKVSPVAIYQPVENNATKTITFRVVLTSHQRTLKEVDATIILDSAVATLKDTIGAEHV